MRSMIDNQRDRFLLVWLVFGGMGCCSTQFHHVGQCMVNCSSGKDLWNHLFEDNDYNRNVRPVKLWTTSVVVNVSLAITSIIEFDEVDETMTLTGKLSMVWIDEYLQWDPEKFGSIDHLHVPQWSVWRPYIALENAVNKQEELGTPSLQVLILANGRVEWKPVEIFHFTCNVDVTNFPFDTQTCSLIYRAFGYTDNELIVQSIEDTIHFHGYSETSGWAVLSTEVHTVQEDEEMHVECTLVLKRKPLYFCLNIILPIALLSLLNLCVFILPVQSGEKASFVVTVFLSLAVYLTIVSGKLPENSDRVSVFNVYVCINTLLSTIIAVITIVQIRIYSRDESMPISPCLQKLTRCFTRVYGSTTHASYIESISGMKERRPSVSEVGPNNNTWGRQVVTWPAVVRALDNVLLLVFICINGFTTFACFMVVLT